MFNNARTAIGDIGLPRDSSWIIPPGDRQIIRRIVGIPARIARQSPGHAGSGGLHPEGRRGAVFNNKRMFYILIPEKSFSRVTRALHAWNGASASLRTASDTSIIKDAISPEGSLKT